MTFRVSVILALIVCCSNPPDASLFIIGGNAQSIAPAPSPSVSVDPIASPSFTPTPVPSGDDPFIPSNTPKPTQTPKPSTLKPTAPPSPTPLITPDPPTPGPILDYDLDKYKYGNWKIYLWVIILSIILFIMIISGLYCVLWWPKRAVQLYRQKYSVDESQIPGFNKHGSETASASASQHYSPGAFNEREMSLLSSADGMKGTNKLQRDLPMRPYGHGPYDIRPRDRPYIPPNVIPQPQQRTVYIHPTPIQVVSHEWLTGPFDCMSDPTGCVDAVICAPCMVGRQWMAAEGQSNTFSFCCCCCAWHYPQIAVAATRWKIRQRFAIEGNVIMDAFCGFFCCPCATCQHSRELTKRNVWPGGYFQHPPRIG